MRKITIVLILFTCGLFVAGGTAFGAMTGILPGPEVALTGYGGILDQLYGWDNLTRIDDNLDQIWFPASGYATAKAKYAAFSQTFGYIPQNSTGGFDNADFKELFFVPSSANGDTLSGFEGTLNSGNVNFVWAVDPSGAPLWTSLQSQNSDMLDHMVTWIITGTDDDMAAAVLSDNVHDRYVIAWEDLSGGGDRDFNDLVVEVSVAPVPIPPAILLLGTGLVAMVGIKRRFKA